MPTDEKLAFTKRLKLALQFNLRHPNESISPQAAHKWLTGKSKPTADKLDTLAKWLAVSPHWLQYGSASGEQSIPPMRQTKSHTNINASLSDSEVILATQLRQLPEHQQIKLPPPPLLQALRLTVAV